MFYPPAMPNAGPATYSCNATERAKGKLHICEEPLGHVDTDHRDGDFTWPLERPSGGANERILEA